MQDECGRQVHLAFWWAAAAASKPPVAPPSGMSRQTAPYDLMGMNIFWVERDNCFHGFQFSLPPWIGPWTGVIYVLSEPAAQGVHGSGPCNNKWSKHWSGFCSSPRDALFVGATESGTAGSSLGTTLHHYSTGLFHFHWSHAGASYTLQSNMNPRAAICIYIYNNVLDWTANTPCPNLAVAQCVGH